MCKMCFSAAVKSQYGGRVIFLLKVRPFLQRQRWWAGRESWERLVCPRTAFSFLGAGKLHWSLLCSRRQELSRALGRSQGCWLMR